MYVTSRIRLVLVVSLLLAVRVTAQQPIGGLERGRALDILQVVSSDVRKHYYDPQFHGVDFDARIAKAKQQIETSTSFNMAMSHVAAALDILDDSHTFFVPPQHAYRHDYGFQYQMFGEQCLITRVRPKSDAEGKGLKPGDQIIAINGYNVSRSDYWKLHYVYTVLRPQSGLRLIVQDPAGTQRQVEVAAKIQDKKRLVDLTFGGNSDFWDLIRQDELDRHLMRARYYQLGDQLMVLKVPEFSLSSGEVLDVLGKVRKYPNLILDLRNNPGGSVETLKYLIGGMFDNDIKIADRVGRKEKKAEIAKGTHNPFKGKLVVLIDSNSASAAELFARTMQLEKRGMVLGDLSSGSVMEAKHYDEKLGTDTVIFYGVSITEWDLIMADGKSLEHVGVTPDQLILPTAQDLAAGRDPVLAQAIETMGVKVTPEEAGKAFPYEWPPEN